MINFRHFMASSIILLSVLLIPGISSAVTYEYDELNRLSRVEYDDGRAVVYAYDAAGNVVSREETTPGSNSSSDSSLCFIAALGRGPHMAGKFGVSLLTGLGIMGLAALVINSGENAPAAGKR